MKKFLFQAVMLLVVLLITPISKAQLINGVAINTTGNSNYTGAILDLSNNGIPGATGFLPPYVYLTNDALLDPPITGGTASQLSGLMVYNTNTSTSNGLSGAGLYYWYNAFSCWVYLGGTNPSVGGSGTSNYLSRWITSTVLGTGVAQDNGSGMAISGTAISPMSMLDVNGAIAIGTYAGTIAAPSNGIIISGQMGIGNNAPSLPNANAIVDLTGTANMGLMLPGISTLNLPSPITAAQNGLLVFNSTIGCPEYAYSSAWKNPQDNVTGAWTSVSFTYADTIYEWTVPPCVTTIKIFAAGGAGGEQTTNGDLGGNGAEVEQTFTVTPGQVLDIVVGGKGAENECGGAGGGGGSFVWKPGVVILIGAGGGGGAGGNGAGTWHTGELGSTTYTPTNNGHQSTSGAWCCSGGAAGSTACSGGSGAGWSTGYVVPTALGSNYGSDGSGSGGGFLGGIGSQSGNNSDCPGTYGGTGGYGGGGGGGNESTSGYGGGGGGGGVSGGGGGAGTTTHNTEAGGGGGGSVYYNTTSGAYAEPTSVNQLNTGNGSVIIYY